MRSIMNVTAALLVVATACGQSSEDEPEQSTPAVVAEDDQTTPTTVEESVEADDDSDEANSGAAEAPTTTTEAAPQPSEFVEPGWWPLLRNSRMSDLAHLRGDIEEVLGQPLPRILEAGSYETAALGTPLTFAFSQPQPLVEENPGLIVLANPTTPGDGSLVLTRPVGVFVGEAASDPAAGTQGRLATVPTPEDLGDWFSQSDPVSIIDSSSRQIDGVDVTRYELAIDEDAAFFCEAGRCVNALVAGPTIAAGVVFEAGSVNVVWEIEQPGPDIVVLFKGPDPDADWTNAAAAVIESLRIGATAPSPIEDEVWDLRTQLAPGTYRFAATDWIEFTIDRDVGISTSNNYVDIAPVGAQYFAVVNRIVADPDGERVSTVDEARELITAAHADSDFVDVGASSILGTDAVGFELEGPAGGAPLYYYAEPLPDQRWDAALIFGDPGATSRLWLVDRPDGVWAIEVVWYTPEDEEDARRFADELFGAAIVADD